MLTSTARRIAAPAYFIALLFCVVPFIDFAVATFPPQFRELKWRTGALGLLAGVWLVPLLGNLLATVTAYLMGHRGVIRLLSAVQFMVAITMIGVLALFALDVISFRQSIPSQNESGYLLAVTGAFTKHVAAVIALFVLGVCGLRLSRDETVSVLPTGTAVAQPLVIPSGSLPIQQ